MRCAGNIWVDIKLRFNLSGNGGDHASCSETVRFPGIAGCSRSIGAARHQERMHARRVGAMTWKPFVHSGDELFGRNYWLCNDGLRRDFENPGMSVHAIRQPRAWLLR